MTCQLLGSLQSLIEVEWFDAGGEVARFPDPLAFGKKNRNLASGEVETLEDGS